MVCRLQDTVERDKLRPQLVVDLCPIANLESLFSLCFLSNALLLVHSNLLYHIALIISPLMTLEIFSTTAAVASTK